MRRVLGFGGWLAALGLAALGACADDAARTPAPPSFSAGNASGSGGTGTVLPPFEQPAFSGLCSLEPPATPLKRWSVVDLDNTLDALFPAGARLADTFADGGYGYARELSPSFVRTLRDVATARIAAQLRGQSALHVCESDDDPDPSCAQPWLAAWGRKLYRRPLEPAQLDAYAAQFRGLAEQFSPELAAERALLSMVLSPYFVLRIELGEPGSPGLLSQYEIAARLSHFATRRAPDPELMARAAARELLTAEQVSSELQRLSALPQGRAARELRIREWLGLTEPNAREDLDPALLADMEAQLSSLLTDVLDNQNGTLSALLTSSRQTVTAGLAEHYGLAGPTSELASTPYAGVLATGAFLTRNPRATQRGSRILRALLCQVVPAPPHLPYDSSMLADGATPRERQTNTLSEGPTCPTCHANIDAPGFALEAFDAAGRLTGFDSSGSIATKFAMSPVPVTNPAGLGLEIAKSGGGMSCAALRLLEYALDRDLPNTTLTLRLPAPPEQRNPDQAWLACLSDALAGLGGSLTRVSELIATSALMGRDASPARFVVALDASPDPLEHAYQETLQFRGVFGQPEDERLIMTYAESLQQLGDAAELPAQPAGGAGGDAAGGAAGAAGAP